MRISKVHLEEIKNAFLAVCQTKKLAGELSLFGSRMDDHKRGGDIDLLWICPKDQEEAVRLVKFDLIAKIQLAIGEQKIDLTILPEDQKESDPFYLSIHQKPHFLIATVC